MLTYSLGHSLFGKALKGIALNVKVNTKFKAIEGNSYDVSSLLACS